MSYDYGRIASSDDRGRIDLGAELAGEDFIVTRRVDGSLVLSPLRASDGCVPVP